MTTYPTLRQRIRLADAIVLADGWRADDTERDELDEPAGMPTLLTVRPIRVLKGEPADRMTLLTTDLERVASAFDDPGKAVLLLQRNRVTGRYVLLFDTVLPVDRDRLRIPEELADEFGGPDPTLDDLAAIVREEEAGAADNG